MTKKQPKQDRLVGWAALTTAVGGIVAILLSNRSTLFPPPPDPTPTPVVIDTMNNLSSWKEYTDTVGSTIHLSLASGAADEALAIDFDLKEYGYVGIAKDINSDRLSQAKGIRFFSQGNGVSNTIELKLVYGRGTVFSVPWHSITVQEQWEPHEALYGDFKCWPDTGPQADTDPDHCPADATLRLDVRKVARLDFAISNKPEQGDQAGSGRVVIDNVIDTP